MAEEEEEGRPIRQARRGRLLLSLVLLVAVFAATARVMAAPVPPAQVRVTVAAPVAAASPPLSWPASGSGALVLRGIGTVGLQRPNVPLPIASVAKVMTALVVLADHPLRPGEQGPSLTISALDAADYRARVPTGESLLAVQAGEQLTERQALEGLLLPSANNIADILARWDGGRTAFLAKMNALARRAGATSTRYTDPSGLDPATVSTAADQVRIAMLALGNPALLAIAAESAAVLPVAGRVTNYNRLLTGTAGVFGLKTGSTDAAGGCLVFLARIKVGTRTVTAVGALIGVDVGAAPLVAVDAAMNAATSLLAAVRVNARSVVPPGATVGQVHTAWGGQYAVVAAQPPVVLLSPGGRPTVNGGLRCANLERAGSTCGVLHVMVGDALSGTTTYDLPTVLASAVPGPSLGWRARHAL